MLVIDPVITSYQVNNKNIRYSGVTKLNQAEQWDMHHAKQSTDFEGQSFPVLTNRSRVWLVNRLRATGKNIRYTGVNCALGPSTKSIRYSGAFVIAGFVSTYFTVILPGFQMLLFITGSLS